MRMFVFLCLFAACSVTMAQDVQTAAEGNSNKNANSQDKKAGASKDGTIKIFRLKYAKASLAQETLSQLGVDAKITADVRLNALVVQATSEAHQKISQILETVDAPAQEADTTEIIHSSVDTKGSGQLVQQFAKISGVEVAFDEEMGIFMIKGPQAEVERVRAVIDQLGDVKANISAKAGTVENHALRVLWLSNEPTEDSRNRVEPDAALKKSIEKLAELGYANMQVKMQLLGRCDIIEDKATCKVEGALLSGNIHRTMNAQAILSYQEGMGALNGKFQITAGASSVSSGGGRGGDVDTEPERASVEVAIKLEPKKYYILSASPVGGYQTAFVVQLVDGL